MAERFTRTDWLRLMLAVAWLGVFVLWPRLVFALTLLAVGSAIVGFNAIVFWLSMIRKVRAPAVAPIVGGIIAAAGIVMLPVAGIWKWAWIPLAMDWGGLPLLVFGWYKLHAR